MPKHQHIFDCCICGARFNTWENAQRCENKHLILENVQVTALEELWVYEGAPKKIQVTGKTGSGVAVQATYKLFDTHVFDIAPTVDQYLEATK